jgi:hypothetical protein
MIPYALMISGYVPVVFLYGPSTYPENAIAQQQFTEYELGEVCWIVWRRGS